MGPVDTDVCDVPGPASRTPIDTASWVVRRRRAILRVATRRSGPAAESSPITVVILDMGGVVIPTLFESVALSGFPGGPLKGDLRYKRVERGEINERDYWAELAKTRPEFDLEALWRACSYVRDELRRALVAIASRMKVVAFTNDMTHWFGENWTQRFPELTMFDRVIEAARLSVAKPSPEAFRQAATQVGERSEHCLFVDDLPANLDGAAHTGMATLHFDVRDPAGSVARVLERIQVNDQANIEPRAFALP